MEARGAKELKKVKTDDLFLERPPKPTKEERKQNRFIDRVKLFAQSPMSYRMAGWLASHPTRFNISHPPVQQEMVTDILIQYKIDIDDAARTIATDASDNWSCRVASEDVPFRQEFEAETSVLIGHYFYDETRLQIQTREFVMGFLGDMLGFKFNAEWLNRAQTDLNEFMKIRSRVPMEFLKSFDEGCSLAKFCAGYNNV